MDGFMLRRAEVLFLILGALVTVFCTPFATAADRALIVGVGDYPGELNDLPGIHLDVDMMQVVAERLGFEDIETLTDQEATYDRFKSRFERWLIDGTRAGDRVLLYFSGHGGCVADQDGDESDGKDETLILYDTQFRDDEFNALLQRLSGRHVLVLIDACHSGTIHKGFNLVGNKSLGVKAVSVGGERWEVYKKDRGRECVDRAWSGRDKTFQVVDNVDAGRYAAFLAAAADHELAGATHKGSLFTLGLYEAINDAVGAQQSLNLRVLRDNVDNFIRNATASPHEPQFWGNPTFPIQTAPLNGDGPIWRRLADLADRAHRITPLPITANQHRYQVGDELVLTIDIPHAGYLNVVNVGSQDNATVLFPNQYHRDNYVSKQDRFTLPTPEMRFALQAAEPAGPSMNVVFLTDERIDLYEESVGGRDKNGRLEVILAALSARAKGVIARTIEVTPSYRAAGGKVIVEVVR